jgi:hypothetical protein
MVSNLDDGLYWCYLESTAHNSSPFHLFFTAYTVSLYALENRVNALAPRSRASLLICPPTHTIYSYGPPTSCFVHRLSRTRVLMGPRPVFCNRIENDGVQQFFCCTCIRCRCRGNIFIEPLRSNDTRILAKPVPKNNRGIHGFTGGIYEVRR